jgi:hypothetical protein
MRKSFYLLSASRFDQLPHIFSPSQTPPHLTMIASFKLAALFAISQSIFASADAPTPSIATISFSGNGCMNNGATASGDFSHPTFTFKHFAAVSPGINSTANCEAHIVTSGNTDGWQVALDKVNVKGHLVLDPNTDLTYYITSYFSQDAGNTATTTQTVSNDDSAAIDYPVVLNQGCKEVWSACGNVGILNVNFRAALTGKGHGYFEGLSEGLSFKWRKC